MSIQEETTVVISMEKEPKNTDKPVVKKQRQISLDVFRGATVVLMILANSQYWPAYSWLSHAPWDGWTLTDLVFPFFLWIVGYSSGIAYRPIKTDSRPTTFLRVSMRTDTKEKFSMWIKIFRRTILLFLLGYVLTLLSRKFMFWTGSIRIMGVLQRISLCFFFVTTLHVLIEDVKYQIFIMMILQTAYVFAMFLVSVPSYGKFKCGQGVITKECSTSSYLDRVILGQNQLHVKGPFDPEGLLSTITAIGTSYIGLTFFYIAYQFRSNNFKRMTYFFFYGSALVALGMIVDHYWFKINKPIWSTSYMLFTGGLAGICLSLLSLITDEWEYTTVFKPFVWFGMNPLVMFFLPSALVVISTSWITWGKTNLRNWIYFTIFIGKLKLERRLASFLYSFVVELMWLGVAYLLYVKEIFIKL